MHILCYTKPTRGKPSVTVNYYFIIHLLVTYYIKMCLHYCYCTTVTALLRTCHANHCVRGWDTMLKKIQNLFEKNSSTDPPSPALTQTK